MVRRERIQEVSNRGGGEVMRRTWGRKWIKYVNVRLKTAYLLDKNMVGGGEVHHIDVAMIF